MQWISNGISKVVTALVFWKDWDTTSTYLLIGAIAFLVISVIMIKRYLNQRGVDPNRVKW